MSSSTTREMRREEYSTNVIRHLQPSRPLSPYSQKSDFDNNLDNILDDLQQSISRPGSSLGQPINNFSSHRDVQYLQPANNTTVLRERSLSPNSSSNRVFKTTKYEYSSSNAGTTSGGERGNLTEINKLDTLLNDLETERTATLDRNKRSGYSNNIGIDSGLLEPNSKVIKTTTTYTSKHPVARELLFDSPDTANSSINRSIRHQSQSPSFETSRVLESSTSSSRRNVTYVDDGLYGKARPTPPPTNGNTQYHVTETRTRTLSPTPAANAEKFITETRTISNNELVPKQSTPNYNEVVRVENSTGPEALSDIHLSDEILPRPKTKVTTTIRTYTYEIPDDGVMTRADRDPPKNNAMFYKTERNERNVNYYPSQAPTSPLTIQEVPLTQSPVPQTHSQNVIRSYKYDSNSSPPIQHGNIPPGGITLYPTPPPTTTIYKTETVTNQQYRAPTPTNVYLPGRDPRDSGPFNGYPNQHPQHPNEPSVIVQRTTTTTRNVHRPVDREPTLHPFPVDGPLITEVDGSPPKRVEDLMATFGDTSEIHYTKKNVQIAEKPLAPTNVSTLSHTQRNVYSSEPEDKNKNALVPSKNVSGPPVYYPPNHELFTRKEESGAAYRAQGGWARGQGKYQYESESKSKSSSKSGAAVVPLCCPLCCAMPCTIM